MLAELAGEALAYVSANGEECGEVHVVAININPEYAWEGRMPYLKSGTGAKAIHIWGF